MQALNGRRSLGMGAAASGARAKPRQQHVVAPLARRRAPLRPRAQAPDGGDHGMSKGRQQQQQGLYRLLKGGPQHAGAEHGEVGSCKARVRLFQYRATAGRCCCCLTALMGVAVAKRRRSLGAAQRLFAQADPGAQPPGRAAAGPRAPRPRARPASRGPRDPEPPAAAL